MKKTVLFSGIMALLMASCASHQKKVLVFATGNIQTDESGKNITVTEGSTHQEKELVFKESGPVTLNVVTPAGKYTLEAKDDALYIANLKKDTIVGSYQHVGETQDNRITQDKLKIQIDSLTMLVRGDHLSPANKNYFLAPGTIVRITSEENAKIFGPYSPIPRGFDASSAPEIYKFYTNAQEWEIIAKLTEMNTFKYQAPEK